MEDEPELAGISLELTRMEALVFFAFLRRIVTRMVAIQNRSGPHHVRPRFRPRHDRRAIRQVHNARLNPQGPQAF